MPPALSEVPHATGREGLSLWAKQLCLSDNRETEKKPTSSGAVGHTPASVKAAGISPEFTAEATRAPGLNMVGPRGRWTPHVYGRLDQCLC